MTKNAGYEIKKAITLTNGTGFALGEDSKAPAPFVTWQFHTDERGRLSYYWGHYHGDGPAAHKDLIARADDYMHRYHVREAKGSPKAEHYKYYSTQRQVDLGTFPKLDTGPMDIINYDNRQPVENGAFLAWGLLTYAEPLTQAQMCDYELRPSRNNPDVRRAMDAQAQIVGKWEEASRVPDTKRLTYFYTDFGCYVPNDFVTPERLADAARGVEAQRAARAHKEKKPPIAEQMKEAAKLAEENRGQPAPKKDAPDRGGR